MTARFGSPRFQVQIGSTEVRAAGSATPTASTSVLFGPPKVV